MKVKINFNNRFLYTFIAIIGIILISVVVYAYSGNVGHTSDQIDEVDPSIPTSCTVDQVLEWNSTDWDCADASSGGSTPSGAVMHFNLASCPSGWTELTSAQGRYLIGKPSGGTLGATIGTGLSNQENRPTGKHSHQIKEGYYYGCTGAWFTKSAGCAGSPSYAPTEEEGLVAGTNAPYIQLLVCQKD